MKRVGLLGGAFNPPHLGHLKLAKLALEHLDLDELRVMPAAQSPLKPSPSGPSAEARFGLAQMAFGGLDPRVILERHELDRGGTSYTVDTLEALRAASPEATFILVLGSDQLALLPRWHRMDRILELASFAMAPRPGAPVTLPEGFPARVVTAWTGAPGEFLLLPATELDLASTLLRSKLSAGAADDSLAADLPPEVLAAITRENLYR
ncbi:MAG: nicotinate (nicotinamide) nucleotide adenylyltransferase [Acidobacteria bacterium]|nr:nicotinate (nicotinamide) nucleotide adenylyltransferase [Acidobacteriota bacterium]